MTARAVPPVRRLVSRAGLQPPVAHARRDGRRVPRAGRVAPAPPAVGARPHRRAERTAACPPRRRAAAAGRDGQGSRARAARRTAARGHVAAGPAADQPRARASARRRGRAARQRPRGSVPPPPRVTCAGARLCRPWPPTTGAATATSAAGSTSLRPSLAAPRAPCAATCSGSASVLTGRAHTARAGDRRVDVPSGTGQHRAIAPTVHRQVVPAGDGLLPTRSLAEAGREPGGLSIRSVVQNHRS
jgi:hypothetical protein